MMKERGTYLVPTLMAGEYVAGARRPRQYPPEIAAKARAALAARSDAFKRALAAGVRIAFGTDSAVSPHGRNAAGVRAARQERHDAGGGASDDRRVGVPARPRADDRATSAGLQADIVAVPGDPSRTSRPPSASGS